MFDELPQQPARKNKKSTFLTV